MFTGFSGYRKTVIAFIQMYATVNDKHVFLSYVRSLYIGGIFPSDPRKSYSSKVFIIFVLSVFVLSVDISEVSTVRYSV